MARIRTIKPEFFTSPDMAKLDVLGRLTFIGLWTHVDDQGRCLDESRLLHAALFTLDDMVSVDDVDDALDALWTGGQILRYSSGGRNYIQVAAWKAHQAISHPSKERLPAHDAETSTLRHPSGMSPEPSGNPPFGTGNREQGKEQGTGTSPNPSSTDLAVIEPAELPAAPARQTDALFDALCEACGMDYREMTDRQRTSTGVARAQLAKVGATPDDVLRRACNYKQKFPQAALTPNALANQWASLRNVAPTAPSMSKSMAGHLAAGRRLGLIEGGA